LLVKPIMGREAEGWGKEERYRVKVRALLYSKLSLSKYCIEDIISLSYIIRNIRTNFTARNLYISTGSKLTQEIDVGENL